MALNSARHLSIDEVWRDLSSRLQSACPAAAVRTTTRGNRVEAFILTTRRRRKHLRMVQPNLLRIQNGSLHGCFGKLASRKYLPNLTCRIRDQSSDEFNTPVTPALRNASVSSQNYSLANEKSPDISIDRACPGGT